jgi:Spy/CpxP family protein refolding chaperone
MGREARTAMMPAEMNVTESVTAEMPASVVAAAAMTTTMTTTVAAPVTAASRRSPARHQRCKHHRGNCNDRPHHRTLPNIRST